MNRTPHPYAMGCEPTSLLTKIRRLIKLSLIAWQSVFDNSGKNAYIVTKVDLNLYSDQGGYGAELDHHGLVKGDHRLLRDYSMQMAEETSIYVRVVQEDLERWPNDPVFDLFGRSRIHARFVEELKAHNIEPRTL